MRLICPNCDAQYEVPDEVIPESGRDVQCSNCGQTWFQNHKDHQPAEDDQTEELPEEDWTEVNEPTEFEAEEDALPAEQDAPEAQADRPGRRALDDEVASVLREEASREQTARAAESGGIETQPDLGLSEEGAGLDERSRQARERMARLRGLPEETPDATDNDDDIDPSSRRNLLPDIDETSSSIGTEEGKKGKPRGSAADQAMEPKSVAKPGGFRRGLRIAVLMAIVATAIYMFAPKIAEMVPMLQPTLASYVNAVNDGRIALNEFVGPLMAQISSLLGIG